MSLSLDDCILQHALQESDSRLTHLPHQQQTVKEENPNATFGEMGKLLGARWKEMDDNAKKVCLSSLSLHSLSCACNLTVIADFVSVFLPSSFITCFP